MSQAEEKLRSRFAGRGWIREGLIFGVLMFIVMTFLINPISGDPITWKSVLVGFPLWMLGGLGYGRSMKWWYGRRKSPQ